MTTRPPPDPRKPVKPASTVLREARLAEALRENLQKRKAQVRSRRGGAEDGRSDGIAAAGDKDSE